MAGRRNVILLGWITPFISLLFTWLATLAEEDAPGMIAAQAAMMNVFQPFTVVIIYLFTNALVTWLAAMYIARSDFEPSSLELVKLTRVGPAGLWFGHLLTVSAVMLPQIILFHAGLWVYAVTTIGAQDQVAQISPLLLLGVFLMNIANSLAIAVVTLLGLFISPIILVILGALLAFTIIQGNFILFMVAARYDAPIALIVFLSLLPVVAFCGISLLVGRARWGARWK